jgi:RNA polymerase sigma-70 factor (ECF subfamily)
VAETDKPDKPSTEQKFDEFYCTEFHSLVRHAMRIGARFDEAEDVAQEAMAQAFKLWATLNNPRAWVRAAANTEVVKAINRRIREEKLLRALLGVDGVHEPVVGSSADPDEADQVRAVLASLPEAQREALVFIIDGFTPTEIAGFVGKTPEAVRSNLREARKRLKAALGNKPAAGHAEEDEKRKGDA